MRDGNKNDKIPDMGEERRLESGIGSALRRAREERGLSLEEVEGATKIRPRYLEGLERGDYSMLPAPIYVRGFLKTYATFLGLDGDALSRELKESQVEEAGVKPDYSRDLPEEPLQSGETSVESMPVARTLSGGGGSRVSGRTVPFFALAAAVLVTLAGIVYFAGRDLLVSDGSGRVSTGNAGSGDKVSGVNTPLSKTLGSKKGGAEGVINTAAPGNAGVTGGTRAAAATGETTGREQLLQARIKVVGAYSWIEVRTDGVIVYSHLTRPGFSGTFEAERRLVILTGNAGAVRVSLNGQDLGALGRDGQVLDKVYTVKNASPGG